MQEGGEKKKEKFASCASGLCARSSRFGSQVFLKPGQKLIISNKISPLRNSIAALNTRDKHFLSRGSESLQVLRLKSFDEAAAAAAAMAVPLVSSLPLVAGRRRSGAKVKCPCCHGNGRPRDPSLPPPVSSSEEAKRSKNVGARSSCRPATGEVGGWVGGSSAVALGGAVDPVRSSF